jgi:REP element-mobilizing transposase RayT
MKGVTLNERVNNAMVNYLYTEFTFDVYKEHHSKRNDLTGEKADDIKAEYKRFKTLLRKYIDSPDNLSVEYTHSIGKDFGRLFSKGIQGLSKKYRGALMGDLVTDIDMVNCHPNILHMICERNDIDCPCLRTYILERDQILMNFSKMCNITKEQAKTYFLKATNDCQTSKIIMPFFNAYDAELKDIQKKIMKLPEFGFIMPHADEKDRNKQGSFINCVMCYYESQIIMDVKEFLEKKSFEVAALMHDGIMIYGNEYQNTTLKNELDAFVEEKWNYPFKFVYKEHQMCIEIPQHFEQPSICDNYQTIRDKFNQTHFKIINCQLYINDGEFGVMKWNKKQITDAYCHINADDKPEGSFISHWLANKDNTMRTFVTMDVFPNPALCPKNVYNLWEPFRMDKIMYIDMYKWEKCEVALEKILAHIKVLCNYETPIFNFMLDWIANMIQYPENKSVIPIIISEQGAGKSLMIELINNLLGEDKCLETEQPEEEVWGKFNGLMTKAFFVHLDELEYKHIMGNESRLKGLVTQPKITINDKGQSQIKIMSFHHFIATTNKPNPVPTSEDDRRKIIWEGSNDLIGNKEYFREMYRLIKDTDVLCTVWDFFKKREVPELIEISHFPFSEYHEELKKVSRDTVESWLEYYTICRITEGLIEVSTFHLWEHYQDFMKARNFKLEHMNYNGFSQKLSMLGKKINRKHPDAHMKTFIKGLNLRTLDITLLVQFYKIEGVEDSCRPQSFMIDDPE